MSLPALIAVVALGLFITAALAVVFRQPGASSSAWTAPAGLCVAFLVFSLVVVVREGPTGFWDVHTASLWGAQVWIDLLIGIGVGWAFAVPRARAVGMQPLPWLGLILLTGCVGLLAMVARVFYLEGVSSTDVAS